MRRYLLSMDESDNNGIDTDLEWGTRETREKIQKVAATNGSSLPQPPLLVFD